MTKGTPDAKCHRPREKVGTIYSWVSIQGAKYRDFSGSRREARAHLLQRSMLGRAELPRRSVPAASPPAVEAAAPAQPERGSESVRSPVRGAVDALQVEGVNRSPQSARLRDVSAKLEPSIHGKPEAQDALTGASRFPSAQQASVDSSAASTDRTQADESPKPGNAAAEPARPAAEDEALSSKADPQSERQERIFSRWFALQGLGAPLGDSAAARPGTRILERLVPAVAVFSVAGGVGKTSLVAALGRVLAGHGEQVLLGETASAGLVPLYFGSRESKPGVVRTFTPPAGSANAPIHAVTLAAEEVLGKGSEKDSLAEILLRDARDSNRILVDVQTASKTIVEGLLPLAPTVLVPLLPDLNSVMTIASVEEIFAGREAHAGRATEPVYLLNQFDASLPLHADVRTILTQRLGSRLLPFVVRSSPAVSEALAEGMTVVDYAPESPVVEDYVRLANWLGSVSPVMQPGFSGVRWTER